MEFIDLVVSWLTEQIEEIIYLGEILGKVFNDVENWLSWLPTNVVSILTFGCSVAVLLRVLGR